LAGRAMAMAVSPDDRPKTGLDLAAVRIVQSS
jgi:hypothetical protein